MNRPTTHEELLTPCTVFWSFMMVLYAVLNVAAKAGLFAPAEAEGTVETATTKPAASTPQTAPSAGDVPASSPSSSSSSSSWVWRESASMFRKACGGGGDSMLSESGRSHVSEAVATQGVWHRQYDSSRGRHFYWNAQTRKVTWDLLSELHTAEVVAVRSD